MRFSDKVVAITGAAQGIGRQTAEQAAAEGAALLLIDRSSYVHELAATLAQSGCPVLALEADLEAWESTEQAFAAGVAHFGRLDVLINNAGLALGLDPLQGGDLDDWNTMIDTNIKGLHCLGDSSGWTRGLMMASVMGVLMGRKLAGML